MAVVGRNQRQAQVLLQANEIGMNAMLQFQALVLDLEIEILFSENVGISCRGNSRGFILVLHQPFCNFTLETSRKRDQSLCMFRKKVLAHARLVVKTMQG